MDLFADTPEKKIKDLTNLLLYHNKRYYDDDSPEISDFEYDKLFSELKNLEQKYPELTLPDSPLKTVGIKVRDSFKKIHHLSRMYSLSNSYDYNDVVSFHEKILKETVEIPFDYWVELKYDGLSINLVYKDGILDSAATRGDGEIGEDVTDNIKMISSVPLKITLPQGFPDILEIRGEVIIRKNDFARLNEVRLKNNEPLFANPRNAAAGSLRQLDPNITKERNLDVIFYDIGATNSLPLENHQDLENFLQGMGFQVPENHSLCKTPEDIEAFYKTINDLRDNLDFEIDGLVIKLNQFSLRKKLGYNSRSPKWAKAYKFPAMEALTSVKEICFQVGRTGAVTPVAILEPVFIGGVLVSRATLHNYQELSRKDIRVGDKVFVRRAGDVIPEVIKPLAEKRTGFEKTVPKPLRCPSCNSELVEKEGEVVIRCESPFCSEQIAGRIIHFVSKEAFNILSIGSSYIEALIDKEKISTPSDLFKLTVDDFFVLERMGDKLAAKLYNSIQQAKNISLNRFIYSLGIRFVGVRTAKVIADSIDEAEDLLKLKKSDLEAIDEIGPRTADAVVEFFQNQENLKEFHSIIDSGVKILHNRIKKIYKENITGKSFVFTGTLKKFKRSEAAKIVEGFGGKVISSISPKTDFLIYGENSGSKLKKASELGVKSLNETEFEELIVI